MVKNNLKQFFNETYLLLFKHSLNILSDSTFIICMCKMPVEFFLINFFELCELICVVAVQIQLKYNQEVQVNVSIETNPFIRQVIDSIDYCRLLVFKLL